MSSGDRRRDDESAHRTGATGSPPVDREAAVAEDADALVASGLTSYRRGDLEGARAAWERARAIAPSDPRAVEYLDHIDNVMGVGEPLAARPLAPPEAAAGVGAGEEPGDEDGEEIDDLPTVERAGVRRPAFEPDPDEGTLELLPPEVDIGETARSTSPGVRDDDATLERSFPPAGNAAVESSLVPGEGAMDGVLAGELHMPPRPGADEEEETSELQPRIELDLGLQGDAPEAARGALEEAFDRVSQQALGEEESPAEIRRRLLADLDRNGGDGEDDDDAVGRRIDELVAVMRSALEAGRPKDAAVAAQLAMEQRPDTATAQKRVHEHAGALLEAFERFLGDPGEVPLLSLPMHELPTRDLGSRAAFLLSRVDGMLSFEEILDISGMPRLEAYGYLARLVLQGIVEVR